MPRTIVSQSTFTGADGTHPAGFTDLSDGFGQIQIAGNAFRCPYQFRCDSRDNGTFTGSRQYFVVKLVGAFTGSGTGEEIGGGLFFGAGVGAARNGYRVFVRDGTTKALVVDKLVNNVITNLRTDTSQAWVVGDTVEAEGDASAGTSVTLRLFRNGVQVGTDLVDSTSPHTAGKPSIYGFEGSNVNLKGDDYEAGTFTAGGTILAHAQHFYRLMRA